MENKRMSASSAKIYLGARYLILALVLTTVLNMILQIAGSEDYYLTSIFAAYSMPLLIEEPAALGYVFAAILLVPFVLAFIFSKKNPVWMVIALVLVAVDLAFLIFIYISVCDSIGEALLYSAFDIIAHVFAIVVMAIALKHGKKATAQAAAADAPQPLNEYPANTAAGSELQGEYPAEGVRGSDINGAPNRAVPADEGEFTDFVCVVSIGESTDSRMKGMGGEGVVRFYANEIAIGSSGVGVSLLIGSAFAPTKERYRFAYSDILRTYRPYKQERFVRMDIADGHSVMYTLSPFNREQFNALLAAHGITIEPFEG